MQNNRPSQLQYHLFIILHIVVTKQWTMLAKLIERVTSNPIRCNWRLIEGSSELTTSAFRHYCLLTPLDTFIVRVFCRWLILAWILQSINDNCFQAFAQPSDQSYGQSLHWSVYFSLFQYTKLRSTATLVLETDFLKN